MFCVEHRCYIVIAMSQLNALDYSADRNRRYSRTIIQTSGYSRPIGFDFNYLYRLSGLFFFFKFFFISVHDFNVDLGFHRILPIGTH